MEEIIRGNDFFYNYEVLDADDNPEDISGWTLWLTVRKNIPATSVTNDDDAIISKTETIVDGTSGLFTIHLTNVDTDIDPRDYYMDVQTKDENGLILSTDTVKLRIKADTTRSR